MDRIVLDKPLKIGEEVSIEGPPLEALRVQGGRTGKILTLTDSEGLEYRGRVVQFNRDHASLFVFEAFLSSTESSLKIFLLQALPERERMELIIQKATELGVSAILPFKSDKSISLEDREAKQKKAHRWQEIALKAVQQSRRATVPRVEPYRSFEEALEFCSQEGLKILLWEKKGHPLKKVLEEHRSKTVYAMVGPEGGWAENEVALATEKGFVPVKLGQRILRTETAAIVLVGILQYELGDFNEFQQE